MNRYLYFTVFASGMTTLAVEMAASHLLGPYFGDSRLVWASLIGLILIYLTAGYFLGGNWADRSPREQTMYSVLAWGAFSAGMIPFAASYILRIAAHAFENLEWGLLLGSFIAVLVLFSVPVTLLGMISPFAIRLAITDTAKSGRVAGYIYAISTLGSFLGTFLPVLVLIPWIGTRATFLCFSGFLLVVAMAGLWRASGWRALARVIWMPVVLAILAALLLSSPLKASAGQIYETESTYNYIQVIERDGSRYLRLNEGLGVHSIYHPDELYYEGPWEQFLTGPFFNPTPYSPNDVKRIAIIGLAAGTTARQATAVFGNVPIDGYEIDPQIIAVGRRYFGMTQPNLTAYGEDGRWGMAHNPNRYSLIAVDAYRPPYIPWHLTTREFFMELRAHLNDNGVLAINVGRAPADRRLIDGLAGTLETVFPSVFVMDVPDTFNSIIYATVNRTSTANLFDNYVALLGQGDTHPLLLQSMARTLTNMQKTPSSQVVFTDDRAPIEWLTHALIVKYVLAGGAQELR